MKLQDCAFNIDVKSAFTFRDLIFLLGVTACQRGAEIKKTPCIFALVKKLFFSKSKVWWGVTLTKAVITTLI